jgi:hypothetical protein
VFLRCWMGILTVQSLHTYIFGDRSVNGKHEERVFVDGGWYIFLHIRSSAADVSLS